ncbi:hypothetical protein [Arcticibacterium luteifluviistationis]|uniref:Uncharacterized protein n=1 Tax=Arcticibacterium luteifluviistationis TaxID=1784714 RepID=A0A2Z4G737_9BACT|nr:hypothetical protein [Arcticibacterium luteifluviistationis]AWV96971.1 hypothetical protein DJ013_01775 [Arcticibacterium luteifluviistationis]
MKKILILFIISIFTLDAFSQASATSENPPSILWQKIENDKSTIIFPKGLEKYAYRYAAIVNLLDKEHKSTIGKKSSHIPIVIHGRSMEPNGFVASVPFRTEVYTAPEPNFNVLGQSDWLDLLAIHEYRHVLQNSNADVGFSKLSRVLTGRAGWSAVLRFTDPSWFAEGDAVLTESVMTEAGRGRMASFTDELRANLYADKHFSYNKSRNGSFKTKLPNQYPFGYLMNLYARKNYGDDIWSKVVYDANYFKSVFYPFSGAIKRNTGLSASKLYKKTYADFELKTEELLSNANLIDFDTLTVDQPNTVTNYTYPFVRSDGSLIARKSSYKETPKLIKRDESGKETKLCDIGISNNPFLSYSDKGVLWLENQSNPRWANVDLSRLVFYNFETDSKRVLLEQERYYYAAINPETTEFVSVRLDEGLNYHLSTHSYISGEIKKSLNNKENWDIAYPMYDNDARILYYVARSDGKLALIKHNIERDERVSLTGWQNAVMVELSQSANDIYFRANFNGIDNVFKASKAGDKQITKVSSVPVGAGYPFVDANSETLIFGNQTNMGYHLAAMPLEKASLEVVSTNSTESVAFYKDLNSLPENENILDKIPDTNYEVEPYKGFFRGWRLHSYGLLPAFGSGTNIASATGFIQMDDILGANSLTFNYTRYVTEEENAYSVDYVMAKYFAKLNLGYEYRGRKVEATRGDRILEFDEQEATVGLNVPLEIIKGNYVVRTDVAANWKGIQQFRSDVFVNFDNSKFGLYEVSGAVGVSRQRAYQNLQSRFGGGLNVYYAKSFKTGIAERFDATANILLPGIGKNHGLEIQQGIYKESNTNLYRLPTTFSLGRGHRLLGIENALRTSVNYRLPLFYPDWGLNGLTYIKRVRMNTYFDNARIIGNEVSTNLSTVGTEISFDQTVFNILDMTMGVRVGYRFKNEFLPELNPTYVNVIIGSYIFGN